MDFLTQHALLQPKKSALIDDRPGRKVDVWTFAELDRWSNRLAHLLLSVGADASTKIVWWGQNSPELVAMIHAIRKAGSVGVPLNYRLSPEEAAYVIDNSDATIVYVDVEYEQVVDAIREQIPKVTEVFVFAGDGSFEKQLSDQPVTALDDGESTEPRPAGRSMIYTSGTTGKPKGAVSSNGLDPSLIADLIGLIGYGPDDVYLTTGPLYHSGPGGFASIAHMLGNTVVLQRKFDSEDWLRLVQTHKVTTTFAAPTTIRMVCNLPAQVKNRYDCTSLQRFIANAAPWTLNLKKMYLADFPPDSLWEVYGSTELGVDTVLKPEDQLRKPGSCGQPAPGIEIKLFGEGGTVVTQPYMPGELYVRSANAFSAYYKATEKYERSTRDDYHTVGDIAYFDEDGYYYIADRKHDMIISGGMNIYPAEVEAALDDFPGVYEIAVFGVPDDEWGESVNAVAVPARPGVTAEEVLAFAREHLASYKIPRSVILIEELPKTGSGKVLKRELRENFLKRDDQDGLQ